MEDYYDNYMINVTLHFEGEGKNHRAIWCEVMVRVKISEYKVRVGTKG
jgi:hypothetical protein